MQKIIYKYRVNDPMPYNQEVFGVSLRKGAEFISFGEQQDKLEMWWLVDKDAESVDIDFLIIGTGAVFPQESVLKPIDHLGTVLRTNGLVWHLFEVAVRVDNEKDS